MDDGGRPQGRFSDEAVLFASTMAALRDPMLVMSAVRDDSGSIVDLRYEYVNEAAERSMGSSSAELIGKHLLELYPSHLDNGLFDAYCGVVRAGEPSVIEVPWFDEGGIVGAWEVSLNPLGDGFVASTRDVTERVRHLADLERSEAKYRLLADHAADVIMMSKDQRVDWVSPSVTRTLGWQPDELIGWRTDDLVHPDDLEKLEDLRSRASDTSAGKARIRILQADRGWRWIDLIARFVNGRADQPGRQAVSVLIDVQIEVDALAAAAHAEAQRRQLELQLQNQQRLESLGLLASGIAHDYNNLLSAIRGHAELARRHIDNGDADTDLRRIEAAVDRAAELTTQLLDYAGQRDARIEPVELDRLIQRSSLLLDMWWPERVLLHLDIQPRIVVMADETRLRQVIVNLLQNAQQACQVPDGKVSVTVRHAAESSRATIDVTDTGIGIPQDVLNRIFDPFFTTKADGRGLGLSVVHGIVESFGGSIRVRSKPGAGTSFTVELPVAATP